MSNSISIAGVIFPSKFALEIEKIVAEENINYIDAIVHYCEIIQPFFCSQLQREYRVEQVGSFSISIGHRI